MHQNTFFRAILANMLDFHLHLARLPDPRELDRQLAQCGYRYIAVACEPWEWDAVAGLEKGSREDGNSGLEGVAYGVHPMVATETSEEQFSRLADYLRGNSRAMVGEAGLDKRFPGYEAGGAQEKVFLRQAKLALELGRDLQIHCVGDYGRIVKLLQSAGFDGHGPRPVFHRFGGDIGTVRAALPLGALFSLHADSFRKKSTAAAISLIPHENIRFETDADETFMQESDRVNAQESANLAVQKSDDQAIQKCADALVKKMEFVVQKFNEI